MKQGRSSIVVLCATLLLAFACGEDEAPKPLPGPSGKRVQEPAPEALPEESEPATRAAAVETPEDDALRGYVDTDALYVRSGPGTGNAKVGVLLRNDRVTILDTASPMGLTWWRIEAAGGYVDGWVSSKFMAHGPPPLEEEVDFGYGEPKTPTLVEGPFQYVGVRVCRECHVESTGAHPRGAYMVWKGHLHSEAFRSLARDYTLEIAKRVRGVEDPTSDWRCVKCHVTAYGASPEQLAPSYRDEDGVGCEVCHGPGSEYAHQDHGTSNPERYAQGFMKLTNLEEREKLCVSCHNEASPTYKPFNVMAFSREIRHWPDPDDAAYFAQAEARSQERAQQQREKRAREEELARRAAEAEAQEQAQAQVAEDAETAAARREREAAQAAARREREAAEARAAEERAELQRAEAEAAAKAALEAKRAEAAAQRERQAQLAAEAKRAAASGSPLDRFLQEVDDELLLNQDGVKRDMVRFTHSAHATKRYVAGVECTTCHHTQEGEEKPEPCSQCHDVGGEAGEENLKSNATHDKNLGFPKEPGQEQVSCVGCHRAQNDLLAQGRRQGEEAPTKCSECHPKKGS